MHIITHGSKLGLHAIRPQQVIPLVRQAKERGFVWPIVKAVDNAGVALDVKAIEPRTLTITRFVSTWDSAQGIEMWPSDYMRAAAKEVIQEAVERLNPEERAAADWIEVLNEADPPGIEGWRNFGQWLCHVVDEADQAGLKIALPAFNFGTPEWAEMVALAESGIFGMLSRGGHLLSVHEGVEPFGIEPLMTGSIPEAPHVPGAGPKVYRYRYLNHLLEQRGERCNIVVSEFYAGGGYFVNNYENVFARWMQYDAQLRRDPYILGFLPFTLDPDDNWGHQNCTYHLTHPQTLAYMGQESGKPNTGAPMPTPQPELPPSASHGCLIGLHGRADGRMQPADFEVVRTAKIEAVKLLSTAAPEDVDALRAIRPEMLIMVRLYADFRDRIITAADFASWMQGDMRPFYERGVRLFEIHNEPNLIPEGLGHSWNNGTEFGTWFLEVVGQLRQAFPEAQFGFPGLSPGNTIPQLRQEDVTFLSQAWDAAQAADWIGLHCYWQSEAERTTRLGGRNYEYYQASFPDHPLYITEFSYAKAGVPKADKGRSYVEYYRELRGNPRIQAAFAFVSSASQHFGNETWREENGSLTAIPAIVGARWPTNPPIGIGMTASLIGNVILRQGPSSNYKRLTALYKGSTFPVQETNGDWLRITDNGWIKRNYAQLS